MNSLITPHLDSPHNMDCMEGKYQARMGSVHICAHAHILWSFKEECQYPASHITLSVEDVFLSRGTSHFSLKRSQETDLSSLT
jgi:hypothetical protein